MKNLIKCIRGAFELHLAEKGSELYEAHLNLNLFQVLILRVYMKASILIMKFTIILLKFRNKYYYELKFFLIILIIALLLKAFKDTY